MKNKKNNSRSNKKNKLSKKASFSIPQSLLDQIDECSLNGYVLFTVNENGDIHVNYKFDDAVTALALQRYVQGWGNAMDEIQDQATFNAMYEAEQGEDGDMDTLEDLDSE